MLLIDVKEVRGDEIKLCELDYARKDLSSCKNTVEAVITTNVIGREYWSINDKYIDTFHKYMGNLPPDAYNKKIVGVTPRADELLRVREEAFDNVEISYKAREKELLKQLEITRSDRDKYKMQWWPQFVAWLWR